MSDRVFVDTNILVYAYDSQAGEKGRIARKWIAELWETGTGRLSTQVLQELYVNITRKVPTPLLPEAARELVGAYAAWDPFRPDVEAITHASRIESHFRLSFWDALIIEAALRTGASTLLTEDLSAGPTYDGLVVRNPFLEGTRDASTK
ncbi:MAG: PIN domain-containing protein [Myxococcota bacterium]